MAEKIPTPENVEAQIEQLLEKLDNLVPDLWHSHPEIQEEWYWVEMESKTGKNREQAKSNLETFIEKLQNLKK